MRPLELTTQQQTIAFLWAFLLGAIIEILYTLICAVRVVSPPTRLQLFIGDVLFMLIAAMLNTLYAISQTEGKVRLYVIAAEIIAYVILYFSIGRFMIKGLSAAISFTSGVSHNFFVFIRVKSMKIISFLKKKCHKKNNSEKI